MSVKAGDIVIELNLDNDGFTARVKDSGKVLRQLQGDFSKTASSVKRMEEHTTSLSTKFRHLVMTIGNLRFVAMDINDVFLRLPAAILKTAGEMERLEKTMTGLSTKFTEVARAAEGAANFKFVTDMAKRAPFEIGAIADAFIKFKTGGLDPTNGSLQALSDSVAKFGGNSESLKRASVAIQQMLGKGVVSMEELRQQLGEAVPTAMRDMADGMGLSMAQLAAKIKTGTVEASSAIEKMLLRMKINNAGAAEAMMETWVGSMARLKTEWALTAKFISERSGFGDAAKAALDAMSSGMSSDEFKRFAIAFGGTLKEAVEGFVNFSRVVIENREALKTLIEVFVLYKAGTAIIYPALKAIEKGMEEKRAAVLNGIAATKASIEADRAAAVQEASNALYRTERRQQELARKLAADTQELASVKAKNQAILADDARIAAERVRLERLAHIPGLNYSADRTKALAELDEMARKNRELLVRQRDLEAAVASGTIAMNASTAAAGRKAQALAAVAATAGTASRASVALGAAMRGLQFVFSAVGGWIGVATIAILAGIEVWNRYGRAAEEAAARAKRAALGLSTTEDVARQRAQVSELRRELAKAQAEMSSDVVSIPGRSGTATRVKTIDERNEQIRRVRELSAQLSAAERTLGQAQISVMEANGRDLAAASDRQTDLRLREIDKAAQTERMARDKKFADETANMDKDSKAFQALHAKQVAADAAAFQATQAKKLAVLKGEYDKERAAYLGGNQTGDQAQAARIRSEKLKGEIEALQATIARDTKTLASPNREVADPDKKVKDNPIQRLIKQLEDDNAGLRVQVGELGKTIDAATMVRARFAELERRFEQGEFDGKGKDGVKATRKDLERLKDLERQRIFNEQLVKDSQDFTQRLDGLGPRYQEAMELLADPLGMAKGGSAFKEVERYFAKLSDDRLKAVAAVEGMDVEGLKAKVRGQALTIDYAPEFQRMAQQTKELNAGIVTDTRESAKARQQAEDETYRNFYQNVIDKIRANASGNQEILRQADEMQRSLDANMEVRGRASAEKFKSPLERMAAEWENSTRTMEEATARWSEQTIDAFATAAMTGKFQFSDLVKSILLDMAKIEMKKAASGWVKMAGQAAAAYFGSGAGGVQGMGSVNPSSGEYMGSLEFANGGVMTRFGAVPLRKYAAGGIADSPQMAIYGEGSMNEAFVPLPDGRRIPVAMEGAAAPSVTVNVINQSGQNVNAQQGQTRFDGRQMVLDVVLSAANAPGPFRDGLKNAVK